MGRGLQRNKDKINILFISEKENIPIKQYLTWGNIILSLVKWKNI